MQTAYGIDFGTTNSVLARTDGRRVDTVRLDDQLPADWADLGYDRVLPSVLAFDGGLPVFGWPAKTRPDGRAEAVKRLFATEDTVAAGDRDVRVEEAGAMLFRHIQRQAAAADPAAPLRQAVVTIPANSRGLARLRTKLAAEAAGIEVLALINEPTAAAMAHARIIGENQRILVFDWGGGTLDVTVLLAYEGTFVELTSKGVQRLGGLDLDAALMDAVLPDIAGADRWSTADRARFRVSLELAKVQLSTRLVTAVELPGGGRIELTRDALEAAVGPLIERVKEPVAVCLRESTGPIDHLVMVGGSSRMPAVQRFVADLVGVAPNTDVDPMTAIAEGAAIAAGILQGTIEDLDFHIGTEHALGTVTHNDPDDKLGEFSTLIARNTKYPTRATQTFSTAVDFQQVFDLVVVEGDPAKPLDHDDNVVLKQWAIDLLEPRRQADAAFDITFEYDLDGILHVLVQDLQTGVILMDDRLSLRGGTDPDLIAGIRERLDQLLPS